MQYDGYFSQNNYENNYFNSLRPEVMNLNILANGYHGTEGKNYLELGCGYGTSLLVNAVTHEGWSFTGVDFNADHIAYAKHIKEKIGIENLTLYCESFEKFLHRLRSSDEKFDYIALHGIYSWISPKNRTIVHQIIKEFLNVGGTLYISYNALPGQKCQMDARHIVKEYFTTHPNATTKEMCDFYEEFLRVKPASIEDEERLKIFRSHNDVYFAHEFLGEHWDSFYFSDVAKTMKELGLSYISYGQTGINTLFQKLTPPQQEWCKNISDSILKEQMISLFVGEQFRSDLYLRGKIKIRDQAKLDELFFEQSFIFTKEPLQENRSRWDELLSFPITIAEPIKIKDCLTQTNKNDFIALFFSLIAHNDASLFNPNWEKTLEKTQEFNAYLLELSSQDKHFACALSAEGIHLSMIEQEFIRSPFKDKEAVFDDLFLQERIIFLENAKKIDERKKFYEILEPSYEDFLKKQEIYYKLKLFKGDSWMKI